MTITDTPLSIFDTNVVAPLNGDGPRAGRNHPVQSHMAADRSQRSMQKKKVAVLRLVLQEGELPGAQINDLYLLRSARNSWARIAFDTPRKRAAELAEDGFLLARTQTSDGNHLPEKWYTITDKGRAALAAADARKGRRS